MLIGHFKWHVLLYQMYKCHLMLFKNLRDFHCHFYAFDSIKLKVPFFPGHASKPFDSWIMDPMELFVCQTSKSFRLTNLKVWYLHQTAGYWTFLSQLYKNYEDKTKSFLWTAFALRWTLIKFSFLSDQQQLGRCTLQNY